MSLIQQLPEEIEAHRDRVWRRDPENRVEDVGAAEAFVEQVGFCNALADCRKPGPSLYVAVCGRRDAYMPRNVQKDPESSLAWQIKDEVMRRGRVYYGKLIKGRSTFVARRLVPHFHAIWGVPREKETELLSPDARKALTVLRREWELASRDLREECGLDRRRFNRALDELQRTFKVIPTEVLYKPTFTYIWSLVETRFGEEIEAKVTREEGLKNIAEAYLLGAGVTPRGELARVTGVSRAEAGSANWSLVDDGVASRLGPGVYRSCDLG